MTRSGLASAAAILPPAELPSLSTGALPPNRPAAISATDQTRTWVMNIPRGGSARRHARSYAFTHAFRTDRAGPRPPLRKSPERRAWDLQTQKPGLVCGLAQNAHQDPIWNCMVFPWRRDRRTL